MSEHRAATATFLSTDIEGSTALLKQLRERYAVALADHHGILREAFAAHGGTEIDNQCSRGQVLICACGARRPGPVSPERLAPMP